MLKKLLILTLAVWLIPALAGAGSYLIVMDENVFNTPNLAENYEGPPLPVVQDLRYTCGATVDIIGVNLNEVPGGISRYLRRGYDLIIALGPATCEVAYNAAQNNAHQNFVLVDTHRSTLPKNVLAFKFEGVQAAYLAGYVAAKSSSRGQIAFIGGQRNTTTINMAKGFLEGAQMGDPAVNVRITYINELFKPKVGYSRANELFKGNIDVIMHVAEFSGLGVLQAAKRAGKWSIGVNTDDYPALARANMLVSVKLDYNRAIMEACLMAEDNAFTGGRQIVMNLGNGGAGLGDYYNAASGIMREAGYIKQDLLQGKIVLRDRNNKIVK